AERPTPRPMSHLVVEFVHPVVTGARGVAAIGCHETEARAIVSWLHEAVRHDDVVIVVARSMGDTAVRAAVAAGSRLGAPVVSLANDGEADLGVGTIDEMSAKELRVVAFHVAGGLGRRALSGSEPREAIA